MLTGLVPHLIQDAETMSRRMEHRGACACDNNTGDGAGVMMAVPTSSTARGSGTPASQNMLGGAEHSAAPCCHYATGVCFLEQMTAPEAERRFEEEALANNLKVHLIVSIMVLMS
ncbi:hypothetical protein HPB52_024636 [Rhipicephalus sanguineus]|uniref:glutamate synthase (ferredoxin) n=1 Tax=Rhipicephalus sanguineus TaxID=34632 RepID=A0A9D4PB06_RHISA|nr:hypothetical protein HPB52_024636 [Rhipicephalus sanguineus]